MYAIFKNQLFLCVCLCFRELSYVLPFGKIKYLMLIVYSPKILKTSVCFKERLLETNPHLYSVRVSAEA